MSIYGYYCKMKSFQSGFFRQINDYKAFFPSIINRKWNFNDPSLQHLLSRTDRSLGRLDAFSDLVDIDVYIMMHKTKEAVLSSKIEGTQTSIEEALMSESAISFERKDDWQEIQNYLNAMERALELSRQLPFSTRLIKALHRPLMSGVRGQHKGPGEFRRSQNWIGGTNPSNAIFVPPPQTEIDSLMGDLEKFANDQQNPLPELLKIAIIHYQFETIHPFQDGNGRIGRLLITLFLVEQGILQQPILYFSDYLNHNRKEYYDRLMAVRQENDLTGWLRFFLEGIEKTAREGVQTFRKITQLQQALPDRLSPLKGRVSNANLVIRALFKNPIISTAQVSEIIGGTHSTAYRLIKSMITLGIVRPIKSSGRDQYYVFWEYLDLFR